MALDSFDREFLKKLRQVARERGVELVLDPSRLSDPVYVQGLRARHPMNVTHAQWQLALDISEVTSKPLGVPEATNAFRCARYIDDNRSEFEERAPSIEQRRYAYKMARRFGVEVPRPALLNKEYYADWIGEFARDEVAQVRDIIAELGWGNARVAREVEQHGSVSSDTNWTHCEPFINWIIETYQPILGDEAAKLEAKRGEAERMLLRGCDRFTVEDNLRLPGGVVTEVIKKLEAEGQLLNLSY
jgi:hypothetical protein